MHPPLLPLTLAPPALALLAPPAEAEPPTSELVKAEDVAFIALNPARGDASPAPAPCGETSGRTWRPAAW